MTRSSECIEIAVAALIDNGRVLLVHRHPSRLNFPDCWDLPGGHIERGESADDAVRRECLEELGVTLQDVEQFPLACSDASLRKHAFLATRWSGTPSNMAPDEHDALDWFTAEEISQLTMSDPAATTDLVEAMSHAKSRR